LTEFKASAEQTITHALGNITIDENDLSDEDDFMNDEDIDAQDLRRRERARQKGPYFKYKELIQDLADRKAEEVPIELDDIAEV
jgi:DNA replication licensing factor MCM7